MLDWEPSYYTDQYWFSKNFPFPRMSFLHLFLDCGFLPKTSYIATCQWENAARLVLWVSTEHLASGQKSRAASCQGSSLYKLNSVHLFGIVCSWFMSCTTDVFATMSYLQQFNSNSWNWQGTHWQVHACRYVYFFPLALPSLPLKGFLALSVCSQRHTSRSAALQHGAALSSSTALGYAAFELAKWLTFFPQNQLL